jgi:hypothetical protein
MINRCVLIVRAKEPFLQWVNSLPNPTNITLEQINSDTSAYLLPEFEDDQERAVLVKQFFPQIFEEQLSGWWTNEPDWPSKRDFALFKKWFDVEFHSAVFDLVEAPLGEED